MAQWGEDPNQQGNSRRWITQAVEASLRRLQTDHIDLYQIHRPSPDTDIEETLSVLTDLMREGKVRTIGSSTFPASEIVEAQWVAERRGLARFRNEQAALFQSSTAASSRRFLPVCQKYGMGVLVWSPLAKGMLTRPLPQGSGTARKPSRESVPPNRCPMSAIWRRSSVSSPSQNRLRAVADAHGHGFLSWPTLASPRRYLALARWRNWTICLPALELPSTTRSWTKSTKSFLRAPMRGRWRTLYSARSESGELAASSRSGCILAEVLELAIQGVPRFTQITEPRF